MSGSIRHNIQMDYSLHDMSVTKFEMTDGRLILRLQAGMTKIGHPNRQVDGYVEFDDIQWDFSYVYLLEHVGNSGCFSGEKMFLWDFLERYPVVNFTVMDEAYGFNLTQYTGFLSVGDEFWDCMVAICHGGL